MYAGSSIKFEIFVGMNEAKMSMVDGCRVVSVSFTGLHSQENEQQVPPGEASKHKEKHGTQKKKQGFRQGPRDGRCHTPDSDIHC